MKDIMKLPDSELEIMMIIWEADKSVTSDYIMQRLKNSWAKTTILNFLTRLSDRGFIKYLKEGRLNVYEPLIDKSYYLQKESKRFLQNMHRNSIKSFITALYDGNKIPMEDLEQLKKFIEETK